MRTSDSDTSEILNWMKECLLVDQGSGRCLWVRPPKNHPRMIGKEAGYYRLSRGGKRCCYIKKDKYGIKRGWLIFLWANSRWPSPCLDHINGDSENDSINNIREASVTQNAWNHKWRSKSSCLPMGVRHTASGRYQARIAYNKKMIHLGSFDTPTQAQQVYINKRKELYGEFA